MLIVFRPRGIRTPKQPVNCRRHARSTACMCPPSLQKKNFMALFYVLHPSPLVNFLFPAPTGSKSTQSCKSGNTGGFEFWHWLKGSVFGWTAAASSGLQFHRILNLATNNLVMRRYLIPLYPIWKLLVETNLFVNHLAFGRVFRKLLCCWFVALLAATLSQHCHCIMSYKNHGKLRKITANWE